MVGLGIHIGMVAEFFIGAKGKEYEVGMGNIQALDVHSHTGFTWKDLLEFACYFLSSGHDGLIVFVVQIPDKLYLRFGYNQDIAGLDWVDVKESECSGILVHLMGRNLAPDDLGKNRILHMFISIP